MSISSSGTAEPQLHQRQQRVPAREHAWRPRRARPSSVERRLDRLGPDVVERRRDHARLPVRSPGTLAGRPGRPGRRAQHRAHDVVVAGAPAEVALQPLAHLALGGVGVARASSPTAAITMPGVQNPHCRPCSGRNAAAHRVQLVRRRREPSIVVTSAPSACDGEHRARLHRLPVESTVHAPHDVVSQPMFVAVRPSVAQVVHEQQPRLDVRRPTALPLTVIVTFTSSRSPGGLLIARPHPQRVWRACRCAGRRGAPRRRRRRSGRPGSTPMVPASPMPLAPSGLHRASGSPCRPARSWAARPPTRSA